MEICNSRQMNGQKYVTVDNGWIEMCNRRQMDGWKYVTVDKWMDRNM